MTEGTLKEYQDKVARDFETKVNVKDGLDKLRKEMNPRIDAAEAAAEKAQTAAEKAQTAAENAETAAGKAQAAAQNAVKEAAAATKLAAEVDKAAQEIRDDIKLVVKPDIEETKKTARRNNDRLDTLEQIVLPRLMNDVERNDRDIWALEGRCKVLEDRVMTLEKELDEEAAARRDLEKKLEADVADLILRLEDETYARLRQEQAQAGTNGTVKNELTRLTGETTTNTTGIAKLKVFEKTTNKTLDAQDSKVERIDKGFGELLDGEKKAFTEVLNVIMKRIKQRKSRKTTPASRPATQSTTGPAKPSGGPP